MESILKYGLLGAVLLIAIAKPNLGALHWRRLEKAFGRLARRRLLCCFAMGLLVLLTRAALLPWWEAPKPYIYDEFGYLLQADTFAHGRLANPPHPLWVFFESPYVLQQPTYTAKYAPGQGFAMALGQVAFGHPWFGVWLSCGLLMVVLCWALQGWLSAGWALFGSFLALKLCLTGYWMNSYWGGAVAAIGGALMLGAYPRIVNEGRWAYAWLLGLGAVLLAFTRMYEGLLFVVPVLVAMALKRAPIRVWALSGVVAALGMAFLLYYNNRVTGHATQLPYTEHQRQYGYAPYFSFQSLQTDAVFRHPGLFELAHEWEFDRWRESRSFAGLVARAADWRTVLAETCGGVLLAAALCGFLWFAWRNRTWSLPFYCVGVVFVGSFVETIYYPHYAAPAAAAIILLLVRAIQELRLRNPGGWAIGRFLSRAVPAAAFSMLMVQEGARIYRHEPIQLTKPINARKESMEQVLRDQKGGKHLIVVRYTRHKVPHEEWVYNRADIDAADVVWAHDMGAAENRKLVDYFKGRSIWWMRPDENPDTVEPYREALAE